MDFDILAMIARGLFTVARGAGYRSRWSPKRLRRVAAEEIWRKEASKRSTALRGHRLAGIELIRHGPCVD
jgi:hypothetical protein